MGVGSVGVEVLIDPVAVSGQTAEAGIRYGDDEADCVRSRRAARRADQLRGATT
jgi:hypothetical protein